MVRSKEPTQITMTIPERLWDVPDVQKFLGVGRDTVYELVKTGELPYIPFGKRAIRFFPARVMSYLEGRERQEPKQPA